MASGYEFGIDVGLELETRLHNPNRITERHSRRSGEDAPCQSVDRRRHVGTVLVQRRFHRFISAHSIIQKRRYTRKWIPRDGATLHIII